MPRISGLKTTLFLATLLMAGTGFAQNTSTGQIHVKSKEIQGGKLLGETTKQGIAGELAKPESMSATDKLYSKLDKHLAKQAAAPKTKPFDPDQRMTPLNTDFWIYDAIVSLNIDEDADGFFSTFTVEFDADTVFTEAEVYARLYLARGDTFEEYHTTSLFLIFGDSSEDSFIVESDLITGFPTGDYELLIELYDNFDNQLVAISDGFSDADLSLLTLESKSFEEVETVVVVTESGGSFGFLALLLVPALVRRLLANKN